MAGNIRIPWDTLEKLSKERDLDKYKQDVRNIIGNALPEMLLNRYLCAVYITSEELGKTGKLVKASDSIAEDIWQSKICLVISKGPAAFVDDAVTSFSGQNVNEGDWVTMKINHCTQLEINGMPCRIVEDRFIEAKFPDPRVVW